MKISLKAIDRPLVVALLTVFIVFAGIIAITFIPLELFPEVETPYVFVTVQYKGASPSEIEFQINNKIEEEVRNIDDIKDITAIATQQFGNVIIQFESGTDSTEKEREVKDSVDNIISELPDDIETPVIRKHDFALIPVMNVLIYGEGYDYIKLKDVAEKIEDVFSANVKGLSNIDIFGGLDREISVFVDPIQLWKKKVSLTSLINFFGDGGVDTPGGDISVDSRDYPVRVLGKFQDAAEVEKTVFTYIDGKPIYLKDLGSVEAGTAELTSFARYNGKPAISIAIIKQSDANMLAVSNNVFAVIKKIEESKLLPEGLEIVVVGDQAEEIRTRLGELGSSAWQGMLVVFVVLLVGIGFRNAIIASTAIPFCFLFTVIGLFIFDETINNLVQFGLIIIIGIVVDGAIVVMENIYRHREMGKERIKAAKEGTEEVGTAVIASVLTTIAAFSPLLFVSGIVGQFMSNIPKTVILALIGSIIFDHFVIPAIASRYIDKIEHSNFIVRFFKRILKSLLRKKNEPLEKESFLDKPFDKIFKKYSALIRWSVSNRLKVVIITVVVFACGLVLLSTRGSEFFPEVDFGTFYISIELPLGSNVEATNEKTLEVEEVIKKYLVEIEENKEKLITFYSATVGSAGVQVVAGGAAGSNEQGPHIGRIDIDMVDAEKRNIDIDSFISLIREELSTKITGARIKVYKPKAGPPTGAPINVVISGDNIQVLKKLSRRAQTIIKQIPATIDIKDDYGLGRPEIQVDIDRVKAQKYGISTQTIQTLMFLLNTGYELASYQYGSKDLEIRLRIDEKYTKNLSDIYKITVFSDKLQKPILLSQLADIKIKSGLSYIRHENLRRAIVVSGEVDVNQKTTTEVANNVINVLSDPNVFPLPQGYSVRFRGENEDRDQSFADLGYAFILGFTLIYFIIVMQLNSFIQPFSIMVTVMLSIVGVSLGLLFSGSKIGVIIMFGLVSLIGIVVNDAIVLVSYLNILRAKGMPMIKAVVKAGETRLRPIILTTLTTIGGLLPLALAVGGTRDFWSPMGWTIIGGLSVATLQTLIVIPVAYSILEDFKVWAAKKAKENFITRLKEKYQEKTKKYLD